MTLTHQRCGTALHLLVVHGNQDARRRRVEAQAARRGQWRKVHLCIDAQTQEIRGIEVTANSVDDAPMLPALLEQIPPEEALVSVSAEGVPRCHCQQRGKCSDSGAQECATVERRECRRAGQKRDSSSHQTFGADNLEEVERLPPAQFGETQMRCFKLLGERVIARDFDHQVAELQIRAALLNRFTQLGTPQTARLA